MSTDPAGNGPTESDLHAMRDALLGVLDFAPTDDQLRAAWANPQLAGLAREWGWGDTELREKLAAELERIRRDTPEAGSPTAELAEERRSTRQQRLLDDRHVQPVVLDEAALHERPSRRGQVSPTGTNGAAPSPRVGPAAAVTVLLVVGVALAGGAGIVLLTLAHQLFAGLVCVAVALALLAVADRRLRRHGAARRAALNSGNKLESGDG